MVKHLNIEFTQKPVTSWGGLKLMKDLVDKTEIREYLYELDLPYPESNRGYDPVDIIESFWTGMWIGAQNFSHCHWMRDDKVLQRIFEWKQTPSQSTYSRFFKKFSWRRNNEVFEPLQKWFMDQIQLRNITLDLDSTVITRYGKQEGARIGYNSAKKGRPSHHPLMAFMADMRMVVNSWLRPGDTHDVNNVNNFIEETLRILSDKKIGLVRGDSGFYSAGVMNYFEQLEDPINYIFAVRLYPHIKKMLQSHQTWIRVADGMEVCEFEWQAPGNPSRRYVAVRKNIRYFPRGTGKTLFADQYQTWRYGVFVTNMDIPAQEVCRMYWGRADAENRIRELKSDFGLEKFCLNEFWATEAAQRFMMVAYNLMSLFRQTVLKAPSQHYLKTIRFKCYAIGSWIVESGRKETLKMSLSKKKVSWMEGLFSKVDNLSPPYSHYI